MDAIGDYWKPVYYLLEDAFEAQLLDARHMRNIPGRKTDVAAAAWIARLIERGLVRPSFVPPPQIRRLRDLTRYRTTLVQKRTRETQRLEFRCENSHQPVLDAVRLVRRYADEAQFTYYPEGEVAPKHKGLAGDWETLVYRTAKGGSKRVVRAIYELRTLEALCDQLRCKGIWVVGAAEFRSLDEDLQPDFVERRGEHYAALAKPLDPSEFIDAVRAEQAALHTALPDLDFLTIAARGRDGAIRLSPLDAVAEPRNLGLLKRTVVQRWGMVPLVDALKEAVLRSNCRATIARMTGRDDVADAFLQKLLLCVHGYGANTGIRSMAAAGSHHEHELYYLVRCYLTPELVRALAIDIANATFAVRQRALWGGGSSAVASDSTHFGAWDQTCSPSGIPGTKRAACSSTGTSSARVWSYTPSY